MVSTQKLILTVLMVNLFFGVIAELNNNADTFEAYDQLEVEINNIDSTEVGIKTEDALWSSVRDTTGLEESTFGSSIRWGQWLFEVFFSALNPWGITPDDYTEPTEVSVAWIILILRTWLATMMIVEVYLVFKNKKAT